MATFDGFIDQYMLDEMGGAGIDPASLNDAQRSTLAMELMAPPAQQPAAAPAQQQQQPLSAQTLLQAQPQKYAGPQMPDNPGYIERRLDPKGYEREMGRYAIKKDAFEQQRQADFLQQMPPGLSPMQQAQAYMKSGIPALQRQGIVIASRPQDGSVNFNQYSQFSPEQQQQFKQFKGREDNSVTGIQRNLVAAGLEPGTPRYQQAMMNYLEKPDTQINMGNIPAGSERVKAPPGSPGGGTVLRPQKGSKDYTAASEGYLRSGQSIDNVQDMIGLISRHGSEAYGKTSGTMGALYGQILSDVADLQNKGVLQQGEMEMIQSQLTDPTSVTGMRTTTDTMLSQYKQLSGMLKSKQDLQGKKFKQWGHELPTTAAPPDMSGWKIERIK